MEPIKVINENTLTFYRPKRNRLAAALFALLYAVAYPILLAVPAWRVPMDTFRWLNFGMLEAIGLTVVAWLLSFAGPDDLGFDFNRRTYRYVYGWPLGQRVYSGPWEDIAAVCVLKMNERYYVGVAWKDRKMRSRFQSFILGTFNGLGRLDRANRLAEETAAVLGLPVVEREFSKTKRTMFWGPRG